MINNVIRMYHDDMAHCGMEKTLQGISANYWYPSLRKRIIDYIDNCLICLMANTATNTREGELQLTENISVPFQVLHIDHFSPLKESTEGLKHILVVVDAFTRFM